MLSDPERRAGLVPHLASLLPAPSSPLLATSPFLSFGPHPSSGSTTTFDASKDLKPLKEDSLEGLVENLKRSGNDGGEGMGELEEALDQGLAWPEGKRKAWVGVKENREAVKVTKQVRSVQADAPSPTRLPCA